MSVASVIGYVCAAAALANAWWLRLDRDERPNMVFALVMGIAFAAAATVSLRERDTARAYWHAVPGAVWRAER